jgi:hypothetical protein
VRITAAHVHASVRIAAGASAHVHASVRIAAGAAAHVHAGVRIALGRRAGGLRARLGATRRLGLAPVLATFLAGPGGEADERD